MRLGRLLVAVVLLHAATASVAQAQTEVRQAKPEELNPATAIVDDEVPSPMLVEVSLGVSRLGAKDRPPLNQEMPAKTGTTVNRVFTDMGHYVCDKARVRRVLVSATPEKKDKVTLVVMPTLSTEYYRQDIDLTVALISDGKEVRHEFWDDLTIGKDSAASALGVWGSSHSKSPKAEFELSRQAFDALFADGKSPLVRIIVAIQED